MSPEQAMRIVKLEQDVERLKEQILEMRYLLYCDCGRPLSQGLCPSCDNDE